MTVIVLTLAALAMLAMSLARDHADTWKYSDHRDHRDRALFFAGISSGLMLAVLTILTFAAVRWLIGY